MGGRGVIRDVCVLGGLRGMAVGGLQSSAALSSEMDAYETGGKLCG